MKKRQRKKNAKRDARWRHRDMISYPFDVIETGVPLYANVTSVGPPLTEEAMIRWFEVYHKRRRVW